MVRFWMKYNICETIKHYHIVNIDDELNIEEVIQMAEAISQRFDTKLEALQYSLGFFKRTHNLDYSIEKDGAGFEAVDMYVLDEID